MAFHGLHSLRILAPGWRNAQVARLGEQKGKGLYSLASIAAFVLLVWGFAVARPDAAILYEPPVAMKHINALLMLLALISIMVFNLPAGRLKPMLKHPMLVSIKLWAFGHLLANGDLASVLLFGSFLVWAVFDRISVKRRGDKGFAIAGPVRNDVLAVVSGVVIYGLFVWKLHDWLFGVPPL